ncbi:hypothetical protein ACH5RR_004880 [Cinchona calisaya]|uniref:Fe2OG dioxygenase domain-containing protein n=1 Tax=Cinchona calisaya TaxID=153742 RepID=A0ABD3AZN3_9GENT
MEVSNNETIRVEEIPTFEGSLPAPNGPSNVPERYIRDLEDMPKSLDLISLSSDIPIIDLSLLLDQHEEELKKLSKACKEWGFFQVVNHGIEKDLLQRIKDATRLFLDLPLEEKNKLSMRPDDIQGYGHTFVVSEEQKLDWNDTLVLIIFPTRFRKYEFWPTKPEDFKEIVEKYSSEVRRVVLQLLRSISLNMGMDSDALFEQHKELLQVLRVNNYPPCRKPNQVVGFSPHSHASTLTMLTQDDDITGLQIRHDGQWVPVKPIPEALVVNVGDVLEIWSNGMYKSIEHRAVANESKDRISFATFFYPPDDLETEPLDNMVDFQGSLRMYGKVNYGEYLRKYTREELQGKGHDQNTKLKIEVTT